MTRMNNPYAEKILEAYKAGTINKYMFKKLLGVVESGITEDLCGELLSDAQEASDAGVHSDDDYNAYFFAGNFVDDILQDTFGISAPPEQKKDICRYIVSNNNGSEDYSLNDLTDYRLLIHKWLCDKLDKKAHPNMGGIPDRMTQYDLDKWISALKKIYASLRNQHISREDAINRFTSNWDIDERYNFRSWVRYFEEGTPGKYNVKVSGLMKEALGGDMPVLPESWYVRDTSERPHISTHKNNNPTEKEKRIEEAKILKRKMRSRLRSLKRLVEKYCDVLTSQDVDHIYDEMFTLDKSINKLDVYASIEDCIMRSANRMERMGFPEGANFIKTALDGKGDDGNQDVLQALPPAVPQEPNLPEQAKVGVDTIINRLAGVSKKLKSRDTIRELASIDILLNDIGLASYFPELTDAQSKLIEAYGYASNKIEAIIAKLRGTGTTSQQSMTPTPQAPKGQQQPAMPPATVQSPAKTPKKMETGDIMDKPVGEVQQTLPAKKER